MPDDVIVGQFLVGVQQEHVGNLALEQRQRGLGVDRTDMLPHLHRVARGVVKAERERGLKGSGGHLWETHMGVLAQGYGVPPESVKG